MTIQMSDASTTDQPKPPAIYLRDLSFAWPGNDPCLVIDTFSLEAGKRLFVHGPSGCGKAAYSACLQESSSRSEVKSRF